ncbi:MAG: hypothetical protein EOO40_00265 [Deltaproteobacteria bacterium]|nr:MAG: hypothetical protein EOO40_00265 [Deltaproteobacteria bacterium]
MAQTATKSANTPAAKKRTRRVGRPHRDPSAPIHQVSVRFDGVLYDAIARMAVEMGQTVAQTVRQLSKVAITMQADNHKRSA